LIIRKTGAAEPLVIWASIPKLPVDPNMYTEPGIFVPRVSNYSPEWNGNFVTGVSKSRKAEKWHSEALS
jgi:hypothetical protein